MDLGVGKKKLEVKLDDIRSRRKEILAIGMHLLVVGVNKQLIN